MLLRQLGKEPVIILSKEGFTQNNPLYMVLYKITLASILEELQEVDQELLAPFYADGAAFDGPEGQSAWLMNLILDQGLVLGYLLDPAKSLLI